LQHFLQYLVTDHGVDSALFEGKIERLIHMMDNIRIHGTRCVESEKPIEPDADNTLKNGPISGAGGTVIDLTLDCEPESASDSGNVPGRHAQEGQDHRRCPGLSIELPADKSPHTAYPFALHASLGDPWDYSVVSGALNLHAWNCYHERLSSNMKICPECRALTKNPALIGIQDRIEKGISEHCPFHYHGTGGMIRLLREKTNQVRGLRLNRIGEARKLVRKANAIDQYKEWIMAVGSGKVEHVDRLVHVALKNNRGICGLLDLYDRAAHDVYHPRSYSEEDYLWSLLFWRLGGRRLADIAHLSMNMPALRTVR
jgi:hypothetical protein